MTWKKTYTLAIVLSMTLFATASTAWAGDSVMVNHPEAKIRNGPATSYLVLWKPRMYTPLEVLATFNDERKQLWYIVRDSEGDVGWIHYSTVLKKPGAIVTAKAINVRKSPGSNTQVLYQAPKNYTFKILQTEKEWFKVEDPDGDKGWVPKNNVWTGQSPRVKNGGK